VDTPPGESLVKVSLRTHPDVLFGFSKHHVDLIVRVENPADHLVWAEADVKVPENLSLCPDSPLQKGRLRIGIIAKNEYLEKSVKVYSGSLTNPRMYKCDVVLFAFNHDGVIHSRQEKSLNLRCEVKKSASL
jgi:hypothetical protein